MVNEKIAKTWTFQLIPKIINNEMEEHKIMPICFSASAISAFYCIDSISMTTVQKLRKFTPTIFHKNYVKPPYLLVNYIHSQLRVNSVNVSFHTVEMRLFIFRHVSYLCLNHIRKWHSTFRNLFIVFFIVSCFSTKPNNIFLVCKVFPTIAFHFTPFTF